MSAHPADFSMSRRRGDELAQQIRRLEAQIDAVVGRVEALEEVVTKPGWEPTRRDLLTLTALMQAHPTESVQMLTRGWTPNPRQATRYFLDLCTKCHTDGAVFTAGKSDLCVACRVESRGSL